MYYSSKEIIVVRIILRLDTVVNHKKTIFLDLGLGAFYFLVFLILEVLFGGIQLRNRTDYALEWDRFGRCIREIGPPTHFLSR